MGCCCGPLGWPDVGVGADEVAVGALSPFPGALLLILFLATLRLRLLVLKKLFARLLLLLVVVLVDAPAALDLGF